MKRIISISIIFIFACITMFPIQAKEQRVYDDADLLTTTEIVALEEKIQELEEKYGVTVICVTTDNTMGQTSWEYIQDFYDARYGIDGIAFLIDMDNRMIYALYDGKADDIFSHERQQKLEDAAYKHIKNGDYAKTFEAYLDGAHKYLKKEFPTMMDRVTGFLLRAIFLIPGAILISYIMMKLKTKKGRKFERKDSYVRPLSHAIQYQVDTAVMVNTETTRVYVPPRNSSSSGGSRSSGRSSGGGSRRSGSGRKF